MGLYTLEFTVTDEYRDLISSPPLDESQHTRWSRLSDLGVFFRPSLTDSIALKLPALRIIHTLLSGTIRG